MKGWVDVISNKGKPGIIKVGYSSKDPELRASDLDSTADPHPHVVEYEALVQDPYALEQSVHEALSDCHEGKEWFRTAPENAAKVIRSLALENVIAEDLKRLNLSEGNNDGQNIAAPPKNIRSVLSLDVPIGNSIYVDNEGTGFLPIISIRGDQGSVILEATDANPRLVRFGLYAGLAPSRHRCEFLGDFTATVYGEVTPSRGRITTPACLWVAKPSHI